MNRGASTLAMLAAFVVLGPLPAPAQQPTYRQLSANEIRARVVGMAITDDAHWSDHFHPGGVLRGYDMGRTKRGTWKLDGDELCLITTGKRGTTDCFEVWASGDAIQYRRDGVVITDAYLRPIPKGEHS